MWKSMEKCNLMYLQGDHVCQLGSRSDDHNLDFGDQRMSAAFRSGCSNAIMVLFDSLYAI